MRTRWFFVLGALLASAKASAAEPARAELRYEVPPACPEAVAFRSQVMARLGYDPFIPSTSDRIDVTVRATPRGFLAKITLLRDGKTVTRERDGAGEGCATLLETVATTVAMALDPIAASTPRTPPEPALVPLPPPPAPPVGIAAPAKEPSAAVSASVTPSSWSGSALVWVGAGAGELPTPSLGATVAFEAKRALLGLRADARFMALPSAYRNNQGDEITASLVTAGVAPCLEARLFGGCAHVRAGSLGARAAYVVTPTTQRALHLEVAASIHVRYPLGDAVKLFASAELAAALDPVTLRVGGGEVWSAPFAAARLGAGVALVLF